MHTFQEKRTEAESCPGSIYDSLMSGNGWLDNVILCSVFRFDDSKVQRRAVTPYWRKLVETQFPPHRKYNPPAGGSARIELEKDLGLNKLIYTATLSIGSNASGYNSSSASEETPQQLDEAGTHEHTVASTVAFLNWVPSYYRSNPNDDRSMFHEILEDDAIAAWILVTKLSQRDESMIAGSKPEEINSQSQAEACVACSGNGCWVCSGSGIREGTAGHSANIHSPQECGHGVLRVRCCSEDNIRSSIRAEKHVLSSQEVDSLQAFFDHRRNPGLRQIECKRAPIVPFGGVSNV